MANEEETKILTALAWAIWQSENQETLPDDHQDRKAMWQSAKKDAMRRSRNVMKRLQHRGVTLSADPTHDAAGAGWQQD